MTTRLYAVPEVTCDHCRTAIESEVGEVAGVETVTVDIAAKEVTVVGDADDAAVRAAIAEAGYEVTDPA
jgi:copper chaperone CopZ